jgi:murein DD-endopeptidase MepM/ murein hydrolase activator NlpD
MSSDSRRPFPQLNKFRDWVTAELQRRRRSWPTPISAPFVRMTSCNEDLRSNYKYFTLGLHGFEDTTTNIFDASFGPKKDVVGYAYRTVGTRTQKVLIGSEEITYVAPNLDQFRKLSNVNPAKLAVNERIHQSQTQQSAPPQAAGAQPVPGITDVQIKRSGLAAPLVAEITWQCYNQQQLEFLRNHFLVIGSYIVLEWGQQFSNRKLSQILNFGSNTVDTDLANAIVLGRRFVIDHYSKPNSGNYDFLVGQVGNFTIDFEPHTNIYKCRTRLVSLGENVWGLMSATTFTNHTAEPGTPGANKINNIHDYFEPGSRFDQLISNSHSDPAKFVSPRAPSFKEQAHDIFKLGSVNPNPNDATFLSWTALTNDVLNDLNEMFHIASDDAVLQSSLDNFRKDLKALLGLGGPPSPTLEKSVFDAQNEAYQKEWVGNHKYLRTTDPDIMVVITPALAKTTSATGWLANGIFGDHPSGGEDRGKLEKGIWLNVEMIREAFLSTNTLQAGIQDILTKMNTAVANYWQLQLFYDDELSVYKVIDYKFTDDSREIPFYVFNSNKNDHHNETLEIEFDSAFPPELISQMMVTSMIQTASPQEQEMLFKRYPLINNTSPFMFAINWTSLRDVLKDKLKAYRSGQSIPSGQSANVFAAGSDKGESQAVSATGRVGADSNKASQIGATAQAAGQLGTPRTPDNTVSAPSRFASNDPTAPQPRKTALPSNLLNTTVPLDSLPVDPVVITSRYGNREAPLFGATTSHPGVDLRATTGTPVYAVKDGLVAIASHTVGYGNLVRLNHGGGIESLYGHLEQSVVKVGQQIRGGQLIGYSGNTGRSTGAHLHFELRKNGVTINPEDSLKNVGPLEYTHNDGSVSPIPPTTTTSGFGSVPNDNVAPVRAAGDQVPTSPDNTATTSSTSPQTQEFYKSIQDKFGSGMLNLIAPSKSVLRNWITAHGYANLSKKLVNGFVYPFPTKTSVELKVQGISGVSISDGFVVDKLPFIFAQYGVFQVIEVTDRISDGGWYTSIKGYFKMLWPDGRGGTRVD